MTIHEASERYQIPIEVLKEYEQWGLCASVKKVMGAWEYDDRDLERLSMIMTLHDIGFSKQEVGDFMNLMLQGEATEKKRLAMIENRRRSTLEAIHFQERQLDRMDYLRSKLRKPK